MKTVLPILVLALSAFADEVVTNYVTAHPDFRIVDSKLYNRSKSVLWKDFKARVMTTNAAGVIARTFEEHRIYAPPQRLPVDDLSRIGLFSSLDMPLPLPPRLLSVEEVDGQNILLKNWPSDCGALATGDKIIFRAMRTGVTNCGGESLAVYDYGTPNVVTVVRTNRVK